MQQFKRGDSIGIRFLCVLLALPPAAAAQRLERDGLVFDGVPQMAAGAGPERYRAGEARFVDWLPDGSVLALAGPAGQLQLQRVPAALASAEPQPIAGDRILQAITPAQGAAALALLRVNAQGGGTLESVQWPTLAVQRLVDTATSPAVPLWAHDGHRLVFSGQRGSDADLYLVEAGSAALPRLIAGGGGQWRAEDWSLDDSQLLAVREDAGNGSQLHRVDLRSGTVQRLTAANDRKQDAGRVHITQARFASAGRAVLYLSDEGSEFTRLRRLDLEDSLVSDVLPPRAQDIELFALSPNGRRLAYVLNNSGSHRLVLRDLPGGQERIVTSLPGGSIARLKFDRGGEQLAMDIESDFAPRDIYLVGFDSGSVTRWTRSSAGPAGTASMQMQTLRFPTWDRVNGRPRELLARVYRPTSGGQHPVLIWLPGDDRQPRDQFDPLLQYLIAERNYVVIVPALRGSGGRGRSFAALDDGALRDDPLRDVGSLLVWAGLQADLDRARTAILGSGDSATLALNSLLQYGDRLRAAVTIDGKPATTQPQALRRPVLMTRGLQQPLASRAGTEQSMWSLRASGNQVWLVGPLQEAAPADAAQQAEILRVIAQFLQVANQPAS